MCIAGYFSFKTHISKMHAHMVVSIFRNLVSMHSQKVLAVTLHDNVEDTSSPGCDRFALVLV